VAVALGDFAGAREERAVEIDGEKVVAARHGGEGKRRVRVGGEWRGECGGRRREAGRGPGRR
jgi:hypothetical protein